MISNNYSTTTPQNWSNYQFEIEKYMGQMSDNPYFNELEDELNKKKIYLKEVLILYLIKI